MWWITIYLYVFLTMAYTKNTLTGKYTPQHPDKYIGDVNNIWYRSSYELRFMKWCDFTPKVKKWNSEEVTVPYISPKDNRLHRYFVDFIFQTDSGTFLVEIKPSRFTKAPIVEGKKPTKNLLLELSQWEVNQAKWKAATAYAASNNWKFVILTEKDLGIK
jgi:hypothetical protein